MTEMVVPRTESPRGEGPGKDSRFPAISTGGRSVQDFDGIDWSAAAPNWASIINGVFLPTLAAFALIVLVDLAFCWLFEKWISHFWSVAPWIVATMMFPLALVSIFFCVKLFLNSYRP